jgi:DNA-binding transcriptional regulator YiaG
MNRKYQSKLLGAIHETAAGLYKIGVITETEMREYDTDCLLPDPQPKEADTSAGSVSDGAPLYSGAA